MTIFVLGLNHMTAPIALREQFVITETRYPEYVRMADDHGMISELVLLSTCNRTEIYGVTQDPKKARQQIIDGLGHISRIRASEFEHELYYKQQSDAIYHLFSVAAGLHSMVIGETQIMHQVKQAYQKALGQKLTSKTLNILFQKSLTVGKKVRAKTDIGLGKVSVASVAVNLSEKIFYNLKEKKVCLLGAGDVAQLLCKTFRSRGVSQITIVSRTIEHAQALADQVGAQAVAMERLDQAMQGTEILLTSLSSHEPMLSRTRVERWMRIQRREELFIVDLGLPRNVCDDVGGIPDVYLYNLDDLKFIAAQAVMERKGAVAQCEQIISEATVACMNHLKKELCGKF